MDNFDPEDFQVCPYDPTHIIRNKRMQPHIHECRKNHPSMGMVKCPFNAAHVIPEAERRWHLSQCPDRHQIHSKIVQELVEGTGNRGCVETPVYRPVVTHGETWEASDEGREAPEPFLQRQVKKPSPKVQVPEEELEGLSARQRRQLYLKKKTEQEEAMKNPQRRNPMNSPNASAGGSKSLALLQQQREATTRGQHQASIDIYSEALRGPKGFNIAIGRGMGAAGVGRAPPGQQQAAASAPVRPGGRGHAQQASFNSNNSRPQLVHPHFMPAGRGQGGLPVSPSPSVMGSEGNAGDAGFYSKPPADSVMGVEGTNVYSINARGRGSVMRTEFDPSFTVPYGPPPPGMWQGGAMPVSQGDVSMLGRGRGFGSAAGSCLSSSGIPFGGITSQPDDLAQSFNRMCVSGRLRGSPALFTSGGIAGNGQIKESSDSEDPEKFIDAMSWAGGGYAQEEAQQCQPFASASSMSLGSNPAAVESWAAHMESVEPQPMQPQPVEPQPLTGYSSSTVSESTTDSDYKDAETTRNEENAGTMLRKLNKKLRQIKDMEGKKKNGQKLNEEQEEKLKKKELYEKEAAELREVLKQNVGN